jgi:1-pyrroline-5-carboxylate dehydrogenase
MSNAVFNLPAVHNEPVLTYVKGSPEREKLVATMKEMKSQVMDIPMYIGGKEV